MYPDEVEKLKNIRCEAHGVVGRDTLQVWHEVSKELYAKASDETKEAVKREIDKPTEMDVKETSSPTPQEYLR